jgi:ssRNA-specific RNase YbeY (16S rRNA maturation enzyme)
LADCGRIVLYVVHGALHLCGFDDHDDLVFAVGP